ncbi:MAG TPA: inosine monophosphate cyclohydrolase [Clostridiales bacterium]|nr:inosine monophosphate cyclohydrolase [Clostridiales bacterium]
MVVKSLARELSETTYPGRGIVIGRSEDGTKAVSAYFIMGRSENSRNRVFVEDGEGIRTQAFDPSKLTDPSLIIYAPVRVLGNDTIVTNGDQTDTIYDGIKNGKGFSEALSCREFEPDSPNFTPRISGMISFYNNNCSYEMSILKSADECGSACNRYTFSYPAISGLGHFLHTYICDGNPIPTFCGEPERVAMYDSIDEFTDILWDALDADNKISLYVRYTDLETGEEENRLINKNERK